MLCSVGIIEEFQQGEDFTVCLHMFLKVLLKEVSRWAFPEEKLPWDFGKCLLSPEQESQFLWMAEDTSKVTLGLS